ncbi:MAG: hypothetical protein ACI4M4_08810 [Candidatus Ornithospirochaeta sp.]
MFVVEAVFSLPLVLCPRRLSSRFYRYNMLPRIIKHLFVEQLPFPFIGAGENLYQLVLHGYPDLPKGDYMDAFVIADHLRFGRIASRVYILL